MKVIGKDGQMFEGKFEEEIVRDAFRHTTAHVLAQAVKRLYPDTKCAIGPAIENGFYYDFDFNFQISEENLKEIEEEMKKIIKESLPLQRFEMGREKALEIMKENQEDYKIQLIENLPETAPLSFFKQGDYVELCVGPHVSNTCQIKAFKLLSIAGAYWRGNEKNKMLTRIYGVSFPKAVQLKEYLDMLEEARLRDHRKIGKELKLFTLMDEGPGFPFFLPKGQVLKNLLIDYWRTIHDRENMYTTVIDDVDFAMKPMNCPGGMLVYKMEPHSYRDLPIRMGELGLVHRHEKSGQLHGLMRVRCFTQDDAHIFMTEEQIMEEIQGVVRLIDEVYSKFGFPYHVELSTRPGNSIGEDADWELATNALEHAIQAMDVPYVVNEGDGAFYGPKLDFHLEDSIGRTWQCGTIQLDFQLPIRFEAEYVGADGEKHRPIMIHRVVFGSIERFIGILIEHYAGKFPMWLAPVQVKVLPISEKFMDYAKGVVTELKRNGIRTELDDRDEKLGYKIREAQMDKVPYMMIVGQKEKEEQNVSVRSRDKGDVGAMSVAGFLLLVQDEYK